MSVMFLPSLTWVNDLSATFNPDRYLDDDLTNAESAHQANSMERDHWAFGAGRRICPGFAIAEREIWLAVSGLLWFVCQVNLWSLKLTLAPRAYNFHQVPSAPISLAEYEGSSGRTPLPFKIQLALRHEKARDGTQRKGAY